MPKRIDLTGSRYGRWVVLRSAGRDSKHSYWHCRCDCGSTAVVNMNSLKRGLSQSCGCLRDALAVKRRTTHGHSSHHEISTEYGTWCAMKSRCSNPKADRFSDYGGRGIAVCHAWRDSFSQFIADMGLRPPGMTLERRDNDGPYSPENCLWDTRIAQGNNKRNNRFATIDGKWTSLVEAAKARGIPVDIVYHRIYRGWPETRWFEPLRRWPTATAAP